MATFEMPATVFEFITKDFESIWNSLARAQDGKGCNFVLALHSMILLEWASRLCTSDVSGKALDDFSAELEKIEPRYFLRLPSPVCRTKDFKLPSRGPDGANQLLAALYDLLRNGQAHTYHQQIVRLPDGDLVVGVVKVVGPLAIDQLESATRNDHLEFSLEGNDIGLKVRADLLFLDFRRAIERARLLTRGLTVKNFERKPKGDFYGFTIADLRTALGIAASTRHAP